MWYHWNNTIFTYTLFLLNSVYFTRWHWAFCTLATMKPSKESVTLWTYEYLCKTLRFVCNYCNTSPFTSYRECKTWCSTTNSKCQKSHSGTSTFKDKAELLQVSKCAQTVYSVILQKKHYRGKTHMVGKKSHPLRVNPKMYIHSSTAILPGNIGRKLNNTPVLYS